MRTNLIVTGVLALRALGLLKPLRPWGSRWAAEQALIERWLQAVRAGTLRHPTLGLELASCCRLVKGYGGTHDRGREQLLHVLEHLGPPSAHDTTTAGGTPALQGEQAAQAAHARRFKPLKLTRPTTSMKERVEPDWRRLRKEDPVLFMALYKADYMMSKPEFSRGKSKTFQPFNRAFSALYNALQLHSECAELKRD
jgi:hypothetical protein